MMSDSLREIAVYLATMRNPLMRLGLGLVGGREGQSAAVSENSVSEGWEGGTS